VSIVYDFLKCWRNASKQTNPLQVDNVITNLLEILKPLEELWTHTLSKFMFLQIQKIFKMMTGCPYGAHRPNSSTSSMSM